MSVPHYAKSDFSIRIKKADKDKFAGFFNIYARVILPDFKVLAETHTRFGLPSTRIRTF